MDKDFINLTIDAGRSTMKYEILEHIFKIYEEYNREQNYDAARVIYRIHQLVKAMPSRVQDKKQVEAK